MHWKHTLRCNIGCISFKFQSFNSLRYSRSEVYEAGNEVGKEHETLTRGPCYYKLD